MRALLAAPLTLVVMLAARSAGAQTGTATPAASPPVASPAAAPSTWGANPVGTYTLVAEDEGKSHDATLIMALDSTGRTKATLEAEGGTHPLTVAVTEPDLVLTTETPGGTMTIRLQRRGDALTGTWTRDLQGGNVTGSRKP